MTAIEYGVKYNEGSCSYNFPHRFPQSMDNGMDTAMYSLKTYLF